MHRETTKDPKNLLIKTLNDKRKFYREGILKLVIVTENKDRILHWARMDFTYKDDPKEEELMHAYDNTTLLKKIFTIDECITFIQNLPAETISIKPFDKIFVRGNFENSMYRIPSNTHYLQIIEEWPVRYLSYRFDHNQTVESAYNYLVKENLPTYPNLSVATEDFLSFSGNSNLYNPFGVLFILPDYTAKLKSLEIMEKKVIIKLTNRAVALKDLSLKIFYRKGSNKNDFSEHNPKEENIIEIPEFPDEFHVYLYNKKTDIVIDSLEYGNYKTELQKSIIVKTSKEQIDEILISKEGTSIEFKSTLDGEFLETIVAFANSEGGTLLLGVDDEGDVIGFHEDYPNTEKKIRGMISGGCEPQIDVNVEKILYQDQPLVVVKINKGSNRPYIVKEKGPYKRVDERDIHMNRLDLDEIYRQKYQR